VGTLFHIIPEFSFITGANHTKIMGHNFWCRNHILTTTHG